MEYLGGGSALDLMKAGTFTENDIAIILREILKGLDYLHSERKLHRDIKGVSVVLRLDVILLPNSYNTVVMRDDNVDGDKRGVNSHLNFLPFFFCGINPTNMFGPHYAMMNDFIIRLFLFDYLYFEVCAHTCSVKR